MAHEASILKDYHPARQQALQMRSLDTAGTEPQFLLTFGARRWQVGLETHQVICLCDGTRTIGQIAAESAVSERFVQRVLAEFLLPNGLVQFGPDGKPPVVAAAATRSHLSLRASILSPTRLAALTRSLAPLFHPVAALCALAVAVALRLPVIQQIAATVAQGAAFLTGGTGFLEVAALMMLGMLVHELGHVTACRRFGCEHGPIGVAVYLVFPVFYADVRASWELPRYRRLVVDMGGLYFQTLVSTLWYLCAFVTGHLSFQTAALGLDLMLIANLFPFFKWDGYWALSDILGVPNLGQKARGLVLSLVTRNRPSGIDHLPPWTRGVLWLFGACSLAIFPLFAWLLLSYLPSALAEFPVAARGFVQAVAVWNFDGAGFALLRLVKLLGLVGGASLIAWQLLSDLLIRKPKRGIRT